MAYVAVDTKVTGFSSPLTLEVDAPIQIALRNRTNDPLPRGGQAVLPVVLESTATTVVITFASIAGSLDTVITLQASTLTVRTAKPLSGEVNVVVAPQATASSWDTRMYGTEYKEYVQSLSPWLYWPLDEGTGTTAVDASGNGRNGTLMAAAGWTTTDDTSMGPKAVTTGANNVDGINWTGTVPLTPGFTGNTAMYTWKVPAWVNYGPNIDMTAAWNALQVHITSSGAIWAGYSIGSRLETATGIVPINTWTTVVVRTTAAGRMTLFMNGRAIAQNVSAALPSANGSWFFIHNSTTGSSTFQNVAYWNTALTDDQMMRLSGANWVSTTPIALSGSVAIDLGLSGTLGEATVSDLALSGDLDVDVDPLATLLLTYSIEGSVDVDVTAESTLDVYELRSLEGSTDVDVDLSGTLLKTYLIEGSTDVDIDASASMDIWLLLFGSTDIDVDLSAVTTINLIVPAPYGMSVLSISAATSFVEAVTLILPNPITAYFDADVDLGYRSPVVIPPAPVPVINDQPVGSPEIAEEADPEVNTYITIRPLWGVIVDMDAPTIEDGKPI
jgi:hypothetical protein